MFDEVRRFLVDPVGSWRTGTSGSQIAVLGLLLLGVLVSLIVSLKSYNTLPLTSYFVWLLLGMLLLRFRPLIVLTVLTALAAWTALIKSGDPFTGARISAMTTFAVCAALVLYAASRQRSGLPGLVSDATLADLRDRLQSQSRIPTLPDGWQSQSAMIAAHGVGYGGDFMVVSLSEDERSLEMILVDVCGKGVGAATQALQFAGALGGLIASLPPQGLFAAANDFLYRQDSDETFATAAHVLIDLETGEYEITSAGHPPVLAWSVEAEEWRVEQARGTALGVIQRPVMESSSGKLEPGQALLFYTDGVVESRTNDVDEGVAWLQVTAREAVLARGFGGAARRIIRKVERGDDDRAVLLLWREAATT
ncbi:MAG: hypothetical protein JWO46_2612 [Nocardioidaceae bacterium]|nr:hypothetical protein [Nocardioidaceae bacterium]